MYKLVIPSAGLGTRSGCTITKALTTLGDKPMIARIIDQFPNAAEVIVILGYQSDYIRQSLVALGYAVTFVKVDDPKRGLGYTLNAARELLQCPFIFCPNDVVTEGDTLERDPEVHGNWLGYFEDDWRETDATQYRTVEIDRDDNVMMIRPKGQAQGAVYTGVCGVRDHEKFWNAMDGPGAIEAGEAHGLKALDQLKAVELSSWRDGGNARSLIGIKQDHWSRYNILEKPEEAIWFNGDRVVKFSTDDNFIRDRVRRMRFIDPGLLPELISEQKNVYSYRRVEGDTITGTIDAAMTRRLLDMMYERVWSIDHDTAETFSYDEFYCKKTFKRLEQFFKRDECIDRPEIIRGAPTIRVHDLLQQVDWLTICEEPYVGRFHGDFHNENIIIKPDGGFTLLDWRQDFDGNLRYGDVYYDLAKFLHGLLVSHPEVCDDLYMVRVEDPGVVFINIERPERLAAAENEFYHWLDTHGFDKRRVRTITALIFLNIAALHHYPYSLFLYYFGKRMLTEVLGE